MNRTRWTAQKSLLGVSSASHATTLLARAEPARSSRPGRTASYHEPGSLAIMGTGIAGLALRMRRERD